MRAEPSIGVTRGATSAIASGGGLEVIMMAPPTGASGPVPEIVAALSTALEARGAKVRIANWGSAGSGPMTGRVRGRLVDARAVGEMIDAKRPDVVVVHSAHDMRTLLRDVMLVQALIRRRVPVVIQFHGSNPERALSHPRSLFAILSRYLSRRVTGVLVLSSEEVELWHRVRPSVTFRVVDNPHEPLITARLREPGSEAGLHLVFAGRLVPEKGALVTIRALAHVAEPSDHRFDVFGDGPERFAVTEAARACPVRTTVHGPVPRAELISAMAAADVVVLPTSWPEGFPTVLAEAMGMGCAIITTAHRGAKDHLVAGHNALFVPAEDPWALARAIDRLDVDRTLVREMGTANREDVYAFAPELVAARYETIVREILKGGESR